MNQLNCLPQDAIFWGHDILPTAVASLDQHGIRRPLTFTVEPLRDFHAQPFGLPHSITSCITLAPVLRPCAESYGDQLQIFYANEVGDLGDGNGATLNGFLESLW